MGDPAKYEQLLQKAQRLESLKCSGELVLLRTDFNVPISIGPQGEISISDATRIDAALPTIRLLLNKGAKLVIVSHLGRPQPQKTSLNALRLTHGLAPVLGVLKERLGAENISFVDDCVGPEADAAITQLQGGRVGQGLARKYLLHRNMWLRPVVSNKAPWKATVVKQLKQP